MIDLLRCEECGLCFNEPMIVEENDLNDDGPRRRHEACPNCGSESIVTYSPCILCDEPDIGEGLCARHTHAVQKELALFKLNLLDSLAMDSHEKLTQKGMDLLEDAMNEILARAMDD